MRCFDPPLCSNNYNINTRRRAITGSFNLHHLVCIIVLFSPFASMFYPKFLTFLLLLLLSSEVLSYLCYCYTELSPPLNIVLSSSLHDLKQDYIMVKNNILTFKGGKVYIKKKEKVIHHL